jgi:hypothetical protein
MIILKIDRSPHAPARDVTRAIGKTPAYRDSRRKRKKVEMLFAHLKRILKLRQLRLRGPSGARKSSSNGQKAAADKAKRESRDALANPG